MCRRAGREVDKADSGGKGMGQEGCRESMFGAGGGGCSGLGGQRVFEGAGVEGGCFFEGGSGGTMKIQEDERLERREAVMEVIVENGLDWSSVKDSVTLEDYDQRKENNVLQNVCNQQQELNNLPIVQQQMH